MIVTSAAVATAARPAATAKEVRILAEVLVLGLKRGSNVGSVEARLKECG